MILIFNSLIINCKKENRKGVNDLKDYYGMQFIMDGNGNYYKTNENIQLVVASDRDEASLFTLYDANQKIGGVKKLHFILQFRSMK